MARELRRTCGRRARAAGFTLVELVSVIAIVLILLGLLLPALAGLRDRAQTVICASGLRQIISAANVYAAEHEGSYPDCWRWVWSDAGSGDWQNTWVEWAQPDTVPRGELYAQQYLRDTNIFLCPTFRRMAGLNPAFSHLTPYVGYSMNEYLKTWVTYQTWGGYPKIIRSEIQRPATLGVFADEGTVSLPWGPVWINNLCLGVGQYNPSNSYCDAIGAFHNAPDGDPTRGKANVAFADGHAALCDSRDSKELFTPYQYKR